MVAIYSGNGAGLNLSSLTTLGARGLLGTATQGRSGERTYVNVATGALLLQNADAHLVGLGPDVASLRTYNNRGAWDFDGNADGWHGAPTKAIERLGTDTLRRHDVDGSSCDYSRSGSTNVFVAVKAAGSAVDSILLNGDGSYTWTDAATGTKETYQAGAFGRILSAVDTSGNRLTYAYDANGLLTTATDASGETVTYTYSGATGRNLTSITTRLASGTVLSQVTYGYDAQSRLETVNVALNPRGDVPAGSETLTSYVTRYTYESTSNRIASVTESDGSTQTFAWVQVGADFRIASLTDGLGKLTSFSYDTANRRTTVTDPLGVSTVLTYDGSGQLTQVKSGVTPTNANGLSTLTYTYDPQGNVKTILDGLGRTVTMDYDANGNLIRQTDALGNKVERTYDVRNQVLTETTWAGAGGTQPLTSRFVYDSGGRNRLRFAVTAEGRVTEYQYDELKGTLVRTIEYRGATYNVSSLGLTQVPTGAEIAGWASQQDKSKSVQTGMTYDARGQLTRVSTWDAITPAGVASGETFTQYAYSERGELLSTVSADGRTQSQRVYDGLGRQVWTQTKSTADAQLAQTAVTQYDDANRTVKVTLAKGVAGSELSTTSTYDRAGRLVSVLQANAAGAGLGTTRYWYDADGRLLMSEDPTGQRAFAFYDAAGRKVADLDAAGGLREYVYDANDRVVKTIRYATRPSVALLAQLVDASGNPTTAQNGNPGPTSVTLARFRTSSPIADVQTFSWYDGAGRAVAQAEVTTTGTTTYEYDEYEDTYYGTTTYTSRGTLTTTAYDGAGRVLSVTRHANDFDANSLAAGGPIPTVAADPARDRVTSSVYDRDGRLVGTIDGEGFLVEHVYDASGRRVKTVGYGAKIAGFTNPGSIAAAVAAARDARSVTALRPGPDPVTKDVTSYAYYDARGRVAAEVDGEGYLTEFAYWASGKLWKSVRYATPVTVGSDLLARPTPPRPPSTALDRIEESTYDDLGRLRRQTNAEGTVTELTYDAVGNVVQRKVALDTTELRTFLVRYDVQGRITAELSAEGATKIIAGMQQPDVDAIWVQYAIKHAYDAAGRRVSSTDANGNRTAFYYDGEGRLRFTVNALNEVSEVRYDAQGRVLQTLRYANRATGTFVGGVLTSAVETQLKGTSSTNESITYAYDGRGQLVSRTGGPEGSLTVTRNAFGEAELETERGLTKRSVFDRRGLATTVFDDARTGGLNIDTVYEFDAFGRRIRTWDGNGKLHERRYDRLGRVLEIIEPLGGRHIFTYDTEGRVLTDTDALAPGNVTTYQYDQVDRTVKVTTPEGVSVTTKHGRHGQAVWVNDGRGNVTSYAYDANGQLETEAATLEDGTTITRSRAYDRAGLLLETKDGNQTVTRFTYDAANRVLTRTVDPGGLALVTAYAYDTRGYAIEVTEPGGTVRTFGYDAAGRVSIRKVVVAGVKEYTFTFHDENGRLTEESGPDRRRVVHTYDALGRRTRTAVDPDRLNLVQTFGYDDAGNLVWRKDERQKLTRYAYDDAGRLVYSVNAAGELQKNEYDTEGRVTATIRYGTRVNLTGLGDRLSLLDMAGLVKPPVAGSPDVVDRRVYDRDGRLTHTVDGAGGVVELTYDGNGNVVEKRTYATRLPGWAPTPAAPKPVAAKDDARDLRVRTVYDALNRAVYSVDGVGAVVEHKYDRAGNEIERVAYASKISLAAVSGKSGAALREAIAGELLRIASAGSDARIRREFDRAGRMTWSADGTGAVTQQVFDRDGNVVKQVAYAATVTAPAAPSSVAKSTTGADRVRLFAYDAAGRLEFEVDASGAVIRHVYGVSDTVATTPRRETQRIAYADRISAPTADSDPILVRTNVASVVNGTGEKRIIRTAYDFADRVKYVIDAEGAVTENVYDGAGNLTNAIAYSKRLTADQLAGLTAATTETEVKALLPAVDPQVDRRTYNWYDGAGRLWFVQDALGRLRENVYDGTGNLVATTRYGATFNETEQFRYDAAGNVVGHTDALLQTESFSFDGVGAKRTYTNQKTVTWQYDYDAAGRLVEERSPPVEQYSTSVDAATGELRLGAAVTKAIRTRFDYDALGNVTKRYEAVGTPEERSTSYIYDAAGRQILTLHPRVGVYAAETPAALAANGATGAAARSESTPTVYTFVTYDAFGDAVASEDCGYTSYRTYDKLGRLRYEVDALGQVTGYARNTFGEVTTLTRYAERTTLIATWPPPKTQDVEAALAGLGHGADRAIVTSYDRMGRATRIDQPATWVELSNGRTGTYAAATRKVYDAFGQVVRELALADPVAGTWAATTRRYDLAGREIATADALGYVTTRAYDEFDNLTSVIEHEAKLTKGAPVEGADWYDLSTLPSYVATADRKITYVYDQANRRKSETRWSMRYVNTAGASAYRDVTTSYDYDAVGNLTGTTDALGGQVTTVYDALGRTTTVMGASRDVVNQGQVQQGVRLVTAFRRDALGNVVQQRQVGIGNDYPDRVTTTQYDLRGNAIRTVDPEGVSHHASYDKAGRLAKQWQTVHGNGGAARTLFTVFQYDALGRQTAILTPATTSVIGADGVSIATLTQDVAGTVTTALEYNVFGELVRRYTTRTGQAPNAADVEFFDYDRAGHLWRTNQGDGTVKVLLYDLLGFNTVQLASTGALFDPRQLTTASEVQYVPVSRRTDLKRDLLGRVYQQILPARMYGSSTVRPTVQQTFDRWGNVLTQTDPGNNVTSYGYDANDQVVATSQPMAAAGAARPRTTVTYDELGRQVAITDALGNVNRQEWNRAGQLVKEIHADGGVVKHEYNVFGERVRLTDALGKATTYGFDALGRNTVIASQAVTSYSVDANGVVQTGATAPLTTTMVYDEAGRKIRQTDGSGETRYTFDLRGNVVVTSSPQGTTAAAFDVNGRQIAARDQAQKFSSWTYDAFGLLTGHRDLGGQTYTFTYDLARQLTAQTNTRGQNLSYGYDAAGQLVRITDATLGQVSTYGYNQRGLRETEKTVRNGTTLQDQVIAYDGLGRVRRVDATDWVKVGWWDEYGSYNETLEAHPLSVDIAYDLVGNRTFQETKQDGATLRKYFYAYDSMNRAVLVDGAVDNNVENLANVNASQGHLLVYDKNGNRIADTFFGQRVVKITNYSYSSIPSYKLELLGLDELEDEDPVVTYTYALKSGIYITEYYAYDAANRLSRVATGGLSGNTASVVDAALVTDVRRYDTAGRVVATGPSTDLPAAYLQKLGSLSDADANGARRRLTRYDGAGRVTWQKTTKPDGTLENLTEYTKIVSVYVGEEEWENPKTGHISTRPVYEDRLVSGYDAAGNVTAYRTTSDPDGFVAGSLISSYWITNTAFEGYQESVVKGSRSDNPTSYGETRSTYDKNGFLVGVDDTTENSNDRTLYNDPNGVILQKEQGWVLGTRHVLRQLVVNGQVMGVYGSGTDPEKPQKDNGDPNFVIQKNFNLAYQPITASYPAAAVGQVPVGAGDTLQSIARAAYGDASLWYLIADANGLSGDQDLRVGQTLSVPTRAAGTHNSADTFRPYDPSKIVGSTSPNLPAPKASNDCGLVKVILVVVVVAAVTIATGAAATAALGAIGMSGGMLGALGAAVGGAVGAAAGSAAGQLASKALGMTDDFSWRDVGMAALTSLATAGVSGALGGAADWARSFDGVGGLLARTAAEGTKAALNSAASQGMRILLTSDDDWSWREVAAAAASAGTGELLGIQRSELGNQKNLEGSLARGVSAMITDGVSRSIMSKGGKLDVAQLAADAFGNELGNAVGSAIARPVQEWAFAKMTNDTLRKAGLDPADPALSPSLQTTVRGLVELGFGTSDIAEFVGDENVQNHLFGAADHATAAAAGLAASERSVSILRGENSPAQEGPSVWADGEKQPTVHLGEIVVDLNARSVKDAFAANVLHPVMEGGAAFGEFVQDHDRLATLAATGLQLALTGPAGFIKSLVIERVKDATIGDTVEDLKSKAHGKIAAHYEREFQFTSEESSFLAHGTIFAGTVVIGSVSDIKGAARRLKDVAKNAIPSSKILGRALEKAGHVRPPNSAAHHIVAGRLEEAEEARQILKGFNIGINDADNGVFLPKNAKVPNPAGATIHSSLHSDDYLTAVNAMLRRASSRDEALEILKHIRETLSSGGKL